MNPTGGAPWVVLCVDDDTSVHDSLRFALSGVTILGRRLELLAATTGAEAREVLSSRRDIVAVLLDMHLQSELDGLDLVEAIRSEFHLDAVRIVALSGTVTGDRQADLVDRFAVNFFLAKQDLNRSRLVVLLTNAIRSFIELWSATSVNPVTGLMTGSALRAAIDDDPGPGELAVVQVGRFAELVEDAGRSEADELLAAISRHLTSQFPGRAAGHLAEDTIAVWAPEVVIDLTALEANLSVRLSETPLHTLVVERLPRETAAALTRRALAAAGSLRPARSIAGREAGEELGLTARAFRQAMEQGSFRVVYQPQHRLDDGTVVGAEALLRWDRPDRPAIPPAVFIPFAESEGLLPRLGEWALQQALEDLAGLPEPTSARLRLAVNLGAGQVPDLRAIDRLLAIVRESGRDPSMLEFELTETVIADADDVLDRCLRRCRDAGHQVAIDDFGTGYSSLHRLVELPITAVKIDRAFVSRLDRPDGRSVVDGILGICRKLNLSTIAEGVERADQAAALIELGCDLVQGFHYSRPDTIQILGDAITQR